MSREVDKLKKNDEEIKILKKCTVKKDIEKQNFLKITDFSP